MAKSPYTIAAVIVDEQTGKYLRQYWQEYSGTYVSLSGGVRVTRIQMKLYRMFIHEKQDMMTLRFVNSEFANMSHNSRKKADGTRFKKIYFILTHYTLKAE